MESLLLQIKAKLLELIGLYEMPPLKHNPSSAYPPEWVEKLIEALVIVESGGDVNIIGDKTIPISKGGPAYGILQIRQGVLDNVNALWGTHYQLPELLGVFGAKLSRKMCRDYFLKICPQYRSYKAAIKAGKSLEEVCSKSWNGGVGYFLQQDKLGYENYKKNLNHYWAEVQKHL